MLIIGGIGLGITGLIVGFIRSLMVRSNFAFKSAVAALAAAER